MVKIKPPNYQFCPFCGKKLLGKKEEKYIRKFCHSCNWTYYPQVFISAAAVIFKKRKVLMVKRGRPPFRNTWMFPGGFVEYGEHPLKTLKREVKEETGLNFQKACFIDILETRDDPRAPGNLVFFYKVTATGKRIKTDEEENKKIAWFNLKKPPRIGWKAHQNIFKQLQKRGLKKKQI